MKFLGAALKKLTELHSLMISLENCVIGAYGMKKLAEGLKELV